MHPLDTETALRRLDTGRYAGRTSQTYTNFSGPFGGFTAAVLLRSVLEDPRCQGVPIALTVNYCAAIAEGEFGIVCRETRTGRSTQHWSMELVQNGTIAATAIAVFGARRDVWSHFPSAPPEIAPAETLPVFRRENMRGWVNCYEMRYAAGAPEFTPRAPVEMGSALSLLWMRDAPARALDYLSLACMSDAFIIRAFLVRSVFVPVGTVTLTTFFHGNEEAMRAQGSDPLICVADAQIFSDGFADQTAQLWGKNGRLLATSTQIVWYKA
jgi:acyl-CoA thioesterase